MVEILFYHLLTTDKNSQPLLIGSHGNDIDNCTAIAVHGILLGQATLALFPKILVAKYNFPVLADLGTPSTLMPRLMLLIPIISIITLLAMLSTPQS